jgi:putative peptidoglycan lipid II flippase
MLLMAPMILPLAVVQINTYMDVVVAWCLTAKDGQTTFTLLGLTVPRVLEKGAVAALNWAALLYEFPLGVFSVPLATAIFPALARHAADRDLPGLADTLRRGLQLALLLAIPATAGLWLLRTEVVRTAFQYGKFTAGDTPFVATTLAYFTIGLVAFSTSQLLVRAFYALKQVRTPVRISVLMVVLNLPLNITLVLLMNSPVPAGLALSTSICAFIQSIWLVALLRRQLGRMGGRRIARSLAQTLAATTVMAAGILAVQHVLGDWPRAAIDVAGGSLPRGQIPGVAALRAANLLIPIATAVALFYAASRVLRNEALRDLMAKEK